MSHLSEIKKELEQREKLEKLGRKNCVALEVAFFKDNVKKCEKCGRVENLTLDHIIPQDILKHFGIDPDRTFIEENLRVLCKICNQFKSNRLDFSTPKTKELLLKFLKEV